MSTGVAYLPMVQLYAMCMWLVSSYYLEYRGSFQGFKINTSTLKFPKAVIITSAWLTPEPHILHKNINSGEVLNLNNKHKEQLQLLQVSFHNHLAFSRVSRFQFWVLSFLVLLLLLTADCMTIVLPMRIYLGTHAITHLGRLRNVSWILDFYLARLYQGIQMLVSISWHACWDTLLLDPCYFTLHQNSIEARSASKVPHNVQAEGHWHGNSIM